MLVTLPRLTIWGAVEISVTIIAASIPFLRALLKEASARYYESGEKVNGRWELEEIPRNMVLCTGGQGATKAAISKRQEDCSDKSILGSSSEMETGIVETKDVTVKYYEREACGSQEWPMPST